MRSLPNACARADSVWHLMLLDGRSARYCQSHSWSDRSAEKSTTACVPIQHCCNVSKSGILSFMIIGFHTFFPSACFAAATPAFIASMGRMAFRLLSATFHSSANMVDVELLTPVTVTPQIETSKLSPFQRSGREWRELHELERSNAQKEAWHDKRL